MRFIIIGALLMSSFAQAGAIYKCTQPDGSVGFQARPCADAEQETIKEDLSKLEGIHLQGKWKIVALGKNKEPVDDSMGEDFWEFSATEMTVISGNQRLTPDSYTLDDKTIVLDYFSIEILDYSGSEMTVRTSGIEQTLRRQ